MSPLGFVPGDILASGLVAAVQATAVLAAGWAAAAALGRRSPATRHQAWTLAVLGALAVPLAGSIVPRVPWHSAAATSAGLALLEQVPPGLAAYVAPGPVLTTPVEPAWPSVVVATWAVGALLVALRFARAWLAAWTLGRRADPVVDRRWLAACRSAAGRLGVPGDVALARSSEIETPLTLGLFRPRVLLPASADRWSAERLNAVLLHELGHVRRHDLVVQAAAQLVCVLWWYNPLAWLAARRLRAERELAADDLVLAAGVRPSTYAHDLVAIARCRLPSALADGAACMAESPTSVRVLRILDRAAPRGALTRRARAATWSLAAVLVVGTAAASPGASNDAAKDAAKREGLPTVSIVGLAYTVIDTPVPFAPATEDPTFLPRVQAALQGNLGELQRCYEGRLDAGHDLEGNMAMGYVISPSGKFEDGCLVDLETGVTVFDSDLGDCVRDLSIHTRYPRWPGREAPSREITVTYRFSPR